MAGTWANYQMTRVIVWLVVKVPHGPVRGYHMAPFDWLIGFGYAKFWDADCTYPYSPYRTHVSLYRDMWQVHTMMRQIPYRTRGGSRE